MCDKQTLDDEPKYSSDDLKLEPLDIIEELEPLAEGDEALSHIRLNVADLDATRIYLNEVGFSQLLSPEEELSVARVRNKEISLHVNE